MVKASDEVRLRDPRPKKKREGKTSDEEMKMEQYLHRKNGCGERWKRGDLEATKKKHADSGKVALKPMDLEHRTGTNERTMASSSSFLR